MTGKIPRQALDRFPACASVSWMAGIGLAALLVTAGATAQNATPSQGTIKDGYVVHQSFDLGGHIANYSGSDAMYDTLVNMQSGPRILSQSLDMHAVGKKTKFPLFDTLSTNSTDYGGDPNNVTVLRMSKGKLYDFRGLFRRDRQYFDYNLLANPLVPAGVTSNGYTFPQVKSSPHLFNTVRRMTDTDLTLFPLSKVSFHAGYSQNIMQGPTFSSIHQGTEALLQQNWRNSTDTWRGGVDWKLFSRTTLTFDDVITHYKGNTSWQLAGANLQLSNGTPVSLGFDNTSLPSCGNRAAAISNSTTNPPTANATCNGYLQYSRYQPTRTLSPTEEVRFQSSNIKNIQMNGSIRYTGASMNLPNMNELFNGLISRGNTRAFTFTGNAKAQRVNVGADYGIVWEITPNVTLSDQYNFVDFRQPGVNDRTQTTYTGTSMLTPPSTTGTTTVTSDAWFLGQKTQVNTLMVSWQALPRASFSIGYRYRNRNIVDRRPDTDLINIHEQGGLFGVDLRPSNKWKINGDVEISYADNGYTQLSPRQLQHYRLRTTYQPKNWAALFVVFNDLERRDDAAYVNHLDHSRAFSAGADLTPNTHYSVELAYGYLDVFSRTDECYASTPAPAGAVLTTSAACIANGTPYFSNGYYDSPTQYGLIGFLFTLVRQLRAGLGYRMTAVDGTTTTINPRQVPGSLQSQYQSPYTNIAWTFHPGWTFKGDWNYYGYGEGSPIGPTAPRSFRGNVYTLGMHHDF
ncbi:MAG: hypothetical protein ABI076_04915 [Acidobacteriaceae bacterium]